MKKSGVPKGFECSNPEQSGNLDSKLCKYFEVHLGKNVKLQKSDFSTLASPITSKITGIFKKHSF